MVVLTAILWAHGDAFAAQIIETRQGRIGFHHEERRPDIDRRDHSNIGRRCEGRLAVLRAGNPVRRVETNIQLTRCELFHTARAGEIRRKHLHRTKVALFLDHFFQGKPLFVERAADNVGANPETHSWLPSHFYRSVEQSGILVGLHRARMQLHAARFEHRRAFGFQFAEK